MSLSDTEILLELIRPSARTYARDTNSVDGFILSESQEGGKAYQIIIRNYPDDLFVIKADSFRSADGFFQCTSEIGLCKRADFIAISEDKKQILFIEMKSKQNVKKPEVEKQLRGASCLLAYCREIGQHFWKKKNFLDGYHFRYVTIRIVTNSPKRDKTIPDVESGTSPSNPLKIQLENHAPIHFQELLGRQRGKRKSN